MTAQAQTAQAQTAEANARMRVVKTEERELLLRHREGDPDAFAALVKEYRAPVYSHLIRCGVHPDERDDLFQEIFIRIHRAAGSYEAHRPVHPWIFTIVSNTIRTHLRRQRVRQLVFAEAPGDAPALEPVDTAPSSERQAVARQTLAALEREIQKLPLPQREIVLLATVEKLPLLQVATIVGIPLNTVKTHLRRARLKLAQALSLSPSKKTRSRAHTDRAHTGGQS